MIRPAYEGRILLLVTLYVVLPLLFVGLYLAGNIYSLGAVFEAYNLSIIAGATAYVTFMAQFLLSARVRFIERAIPQDKLLALHGLTGMITAALILAHFVLKYLLLVRFSGITLQSALGAVILVVYAVLAPAAILILRRRGPARRSGSPPYQKIRITHNLFAAAGVLAVIHVFMASSTWSLSLRGFTLLWGGFTLGAYVHHKLLRPRRRAVFTVASVDRLSPGVHRYEFIADPAHPARDRHAGQFGYWSFQSSVIGPEEHPFTVASPPDENPAIVVRTSGDYTGTMPVVAAGSTVYFDGPYGHFTPVGLAEGTPLFLLAGGIGITPFLSIAGDDGVREKYPIVLLWSIHAREDSVVAVKLEELAKRGALTMKTICSSESGRLGRANIEEMLGEAGANNAEVFLCGSSGFTSDMKASLRALGVNRKRIHEERFGW